MRDSDRVASAPERRQADPESRRFKDLDFRLLGTDQSWRGVFPMSSRLHRRNDCVMSGELLSRNIGIFSVRSFDELR